ncbi:unnamed protein product, partial [marine sediment metagenome]
MKSHTKKLGRTPIVILALFSFALVFSVFLTWAADSPAPTFCEIVDITAPVFAETGEGIEIDIRYT